MGQGKMRRPQLAAAHGFADERTAGKHTAVEETGADGRTAGPGGVGGDAIERPPPEERPEAAAERPRPNAAMKGSADDADYGAKKKKILVIDDRSFCRECVVRLLRDTLPDHVFVAIGRPQELLSSDLTPGNSEPFDVVILCSGATQLPDDQVAADIDYIRNCFNETPIILLSDWEDSSQVGEALHYGVRGFIPTTLVSGVVREAVRLVAAGGTFIPASALVHALGGVWQSSGDDRRRGDGQVAGLTPREIDVLRLLREGRPNKIIAHELDLKETTVKIHVRHIMKKLKAANRTEAALMAERALGQ